MIKKGDFLVCKKSYKEYKYFIKEGQVCEIKSIQNHVTGVYILISNFYLCFDDINIWEYFISPAEWRDRQIDKILEDD